MGSKEDRLFWIVNTEGRYLADRISAVFDGIPYRWTQHPDKAKRLTDAEAAEAIEWAINDDPFAEIVPAGWEV